MTEVRSILDLRLHERSDLVPAMTPDEYNDLVEDIIDRGIVVPIEILDDGTVIDGRHRYAIAQTLGLAEVPVRVIEPDDPIDYMIRAALLRRQLTASQRAMLARELPRYREAKAEAARREQAGVKDPSALVREGPTGKAAEEVAATVGVSTRYVEMAEQVAREDPAAAAAVRAGTLSLTAASRNVRASKSRPKPKEKAAVATIHRVHAEPLRPSITVVMKAFRRDLAILLDAYEALAEDERFAAAFGPLMAAMRAALEEERS